MNIPNFNIIDYAVRLDEIAEEIKALKAKEKELLFDIKEYFKEDIEARFKSKVTPFGVATISFGGVEVKVDRPKRIEWDQEGLKTLRDKIAQHEDPSQYIKEKLDVSETEFKKWSKDIQDVFDKHRTVKDGTEKITLKVKEK